MKWITRERPKIDRIACPWLIARFIDKAPEFLYVPADQVMTVAAQTGAVPYDVPGVEMGHVGEHCSFDAFIAKYRLDDGALNKLALIVRAADCGQPQLAKEAAGLLAISKGLSLNFEERSTGFVWFFSFLVWYADVRKRYGDNLLILLDDPGLGLHAKAQWDLMRYVNRKTFSISLKSEKGRALRALERPGLWNGSMHGWTTIFVEVPIETFNPVKTAEDLLRPNHLPA